MPFAAAMRVLIVDDQLTSRLLIGGGLQELGICEIEMAADGEQGFKSMITKAPIW
jgi:two-component system chemotaxis response regulator CheY